MGLRLVYDGFIGIFDRVDTVQHVRISRPKYLDKSAELFQM